MPSKNPIQLAETAGRADRRNDVKSFLLGKLKEENAMWAYNPESITVEKVDDDNLIAWTMRHLDLDEIALLFSIYPKSKIKKAWRRLLVPEGEYLYTLNRFFAWYYFDAKNPDSYLKNLQTRHLNSLFK